MQVRFVRLYFLYLNALYPMVCKTSFYHCGLRLGEHGQQAVSPAACASQS